MSDSVIERMQKQLQQLLDREEIRQQIANYSRSVDRCDADLGKKVFHRDSRLDYGGWKGNGWDFIDGCLPVHLTWPSHSHQMSTISIWLDGDDRARSETYGDCTLRRPGPDGTIRDNRRLVRYIDRWVKEDGRWQIIERVLADDMDQVLHTDDHSGMKTGRRDKDDPSYFPG